MVVPIKAIAGVELDLQEGNQIAAARVTDNTARFRLSWDRFVRLKAAAEAIQAMPPGRILDAGGYDGALSLFLPDYKVEVIDPATTGGSILDIPAANASYPAVIAVDVLEHIDPEDRAKALSEFARVAATHIILNYPCRDSKEAQKLAFKLTNNSLIREHVEWELPDSNWVLSELAKHGFRGTVRAHTSVAVWLGQYLTLNLMPEVAAELNGHLVENFDDEPFTKPLYHLLTCERNR
jgi:hypothetical protein